jgi:hypothetical protein
MTYGIFTAPRRKQKRRLTIHDVNRMETVREDRPKNETLKSFTQAEETRLANEKAAKDAAEEQRILAPLRAEARKAAERVSKYFRHTPLSDLRSGIDTEISPCDPIGSYYVTAGGNQGDVAAAYKAFKNNLESHGCTLTADGWTRFGSYLTSLFFHRDVSMSNIENLATALERCVELNIFADGEITGYQPTRERIEPTQAAKKKDHPLDELESLSQKDREKEIAIVNQAHFDDCAPLVREWFALLESTWGFVPTREQLDAVTAWFRYNGANWKLHSEYNKCRLALVRAGVFPPHMVTDEERQAEMIDQTDFATKTPYQRNQFLARAITRAALDSVR